MKKILIAALAIAALSLAGCGHKSKPSSEEAEQQRLELYDAMSDHDIARVEQIADSLSLMTDDLSTDETVAVLLAFLQVHNEAASRKDATKDLVTIRKFVDVYDIALARDGDELSRAFNAARDLNGNLDLPEIAKVFREQLADYDASMGGESATIEEIATGTTSEKTEEKPSAEKATDKPAAEQPTAGTPE